MISVHFDDYTAFSSPLAEFKEEMQRRGWGTGSSTSDAANPPPCEHRFAATIRRLAT
jgi:hypothetical protein